MTNLKFYYDCRKEEIFTSEYSYYGDDNIFKLNAQTQEEAEIEVGKQELPSMRKPYYIWVGYACSELKCFASLAEAEHAGEQSGISPYSADLVTCICNWKDAPDHQ